MHGLESIKKQNDYYAEKAAKERLNFDKIWAECLHKAHTKQ